MKKLINTIFILVMISFFSSSISVAEVIRLEPTEKNKITLSDKKEALNKNLVIKDKNITGEILWVTKL